MSKKVLTVVIPTYNRNILFKKSLLNFLKFKDYIDIFLVEDGSTKEVIEKNKNFLENCCKIKKGYEARKTLAVCPSRMLQYLFAIYLMSGASEGKFIVMLCK